MMIICLLLITAQVRLYFSTFHPPDGASPGIANVSHCVICKALEYFSQVAINNASELNFNEDEAAAIPGSSLH